MGLDAYLEDDFGEELDSALDDDGRLGASWPTGDAGYPLLRHVDPEGTTTFNRLQLAAVIPELQALEKAVAADLKPRVARLIKLARRAESEPHLFLRFLGD